MALAFDWGSLWHICVDYYITGIMVSEMAEESGVRLSMQKNCLFFSRKIFMFLIHDEADSTLSIPCACVVFRLDGARFRLCAIQGHC